MPALALCRGRAVATAEITIRDERRFGTVVVRLRFRESPALPQSLVIGYWDNQFDEQRPALKRRIVDFADGPPVVEVRAGGDELTVERGG